MRLDLGADIEQQRAAAVKRVTAMTRAAHEAHENAGGYTHQHAQHLQMQGEGTLASRASYDFHLHLEECRQRAIRQIQLAPHGAGVADIVTVFTKNISG
jgi:putative heme degradation protein